MSCNKGQVSIIIPTYNRSHLIGETLDSILAQTYENWECIIIDDDSTDQTIKLLEFYQNKDERFKYFKRPDSLRAGANSCRNLGLKLSHGEFLIFFDSDDIMLPEKLNCHVCALEGFYNFSISKFNKFLDGHIQQENIFDINIRNEINPGNYLRFHNFWGTINVLFKRDALKAIRFNEFLPSGQEYDFFVNFLFHNEVRPVFLNKVLSIRRIHEKSIQSQQKVNQPQYLVNKYLIFKTTFEGIKYKATVGEKSFLLKNCQSFSFRLACAGKRIPGYLAFNYILCKEAGLKRLLLYNLSIISGYSFKKGYCLLYMSFLPK